MATEPSERARTLIERAGRLADQVAEDLRAEHPDFFAPDVENRTLDAWNRLTDAALAARAQVRRRAVDAGVYGAFLPEDRGGAGLSALEVVLLEEKLATRAPYGGPLWPDFTIHLLGRAWGPNQLLLAGTTTETKDYLARLVTAELTTCIAMTDPGAGSDPMNMTSSATRRGGDFVVNAHKRFVGNAPYADLMLLFARTSGQRGDRHGISLLVLESGDAGVRVPEVNPVMEGLGNHGEVVIEDCVIPASRLVGEQGQGLALGLGFVYSARLSVAARCLGGAQWLLDRTVERLNTHTTWDEKLADRQGLRWLLAEVALAVEQLRWLVRHTASRVDSGADARAHTAMAKLSAARVYHQAADLAIQVHGGLGYLADAPYERAYRRARGYRLIEGTDEMQKETLARLVLAGKVF